MTAPSPLVLPSTVLGEALPTTSAPGPVDPLPLPDPGWGAAAARAAVAEAALALPALTATAELVRAVSTVVFRVGEHAVKVHPPGTDPGHLARVHAVLAASPVALTAPAPPVVTSHGIVTVTPWLPAAAPLGWRAVGRTLRELHDLPTAASLPGWAPLRRLPAQLDHLPTPYARIVQDRRELLLERLARLVPELPAGALHGDVSPENVLRTRAGARWIDLDFACWGLREYDLSAVVRRAATGRISERDYRSFARGYGADLRGWPGLGLLDELCALSGLGFRLWCDRAEGRVSQWLPVELGRLSAVPAAR